MASQNGCLQVCSSTDSSALSIITTGSHWHVSGHSACSIAFYIVAEEPTHHAKSSTDRRPELVATSASEGGLSRLVVGVAGVVAVIALLAVVAPQM